MTGNPGTPCDERRAIFVAAAGSDGRPRSNDETRPPNSSHLNTTGYQFAREFSLTEGAAGELAVIWDLAAAINAGWWRAVTSRGRTARDIRYVWRPAARHASLTHPERG